MKSLRVVPVFLVFGKHIMKSLRTLPAARRVGEAERQLRLLFEEAARHAPSIIFFDEMDGLAPVRSSKQVGAPSKRLI
eukprot:scaffold84754_cov18-Tisochrysis_lutea.AAC.1